MNDNILHLLIFHSHKAIRVSRSCKLLFLFFDISDKCVVINMNICEYNNQNTRNVKLNLNSFYSNCNT